MRMVVVLAAALAAGATGAGAQADLGKLVDHDGELLLCFDVQAARLDDGRSDVRSVAAAVLAACGPVKMKKMAAAGFTSQAAVANAVQATREQDVDRASIAVLKKRKGG